VLKQTGNDVAVSITEGDHLIAFEVLVTAEAEIVPALL
jgi:hypothetical protein